MSRTQLALTWAFAAALTLPWLAAVAARAALGRTVSRLLDCLMHQPAGALGCECDQPGKKGLHDRDRCWQFDPGVPEPIAPLHSPIWRGGAS